MRRTFKLCKTCLESYDVAIGKACKCEEIQESKRSERYTGINFSVFTGFETDHVDGQNHKIRSQKDFDKLCEVNGCVPYLESNFKERHEKYQERWEKINAIDAEKAGLKIEVGGLEKVKQFQQQEAARG